MATRWIQQMEISDYINERPRRAQKYSGDVNKAERRLLLLFVSFAMLCIIQAALNVSLRLTLHSSKESTHLDCNATHFSDQNRVKVQQDCGEWSPGQCNKLQERFNALTREKNLLENQITELNNMIRNMQGDRDRLKMKLRELKASLQCPADWKEINSRCYFLSNESRTWEDSRKYCQDKGADLVVINSEQEQRSLYRLNGDDYLLLWIGLYDKAGIFKWVDGAALTKTFWQAGQPDNGGPNIREDCVEMYHANPVLANWNDAPCGHKRRWLCEKDPCSTE